MAQRIRYSKTEDSSYLRSVKIYNHPTNGARYQVVLNTNEKQWLIIDTTCDLVAASGRTNSLHRMKMQAKDALTLLGVSFADETRRERVQKAS